MAILLVYSGNVSEFLFGLYHDFFCDLTYYLDQPNVRGQYPNHINGPNAYLPQASWRLFKASSEFLSKRWSSLPQCQRSMATSHQCQRYHITKVGSQNSR